MSVTASDPRHELQQRGYCLLRGVLPAELLSTAREILQCWIEEQIARWQREGRLTRAPAETGFRRRLLAAWEDAQRPHYERSPRGLLVPLAPERLFRVLTHPALLDIAGELLGSGDLVSHEIWNSRPKAPQQRFTDTPWHQDAQYFPSQAQRRMVNLWWPLHAVDTENSCLAVAPGIHAREELFAGHDDESGFIGIAPEEVAELEEVPIAMEPGDVLAFTNLTPHRAMPNRSDGMRWSFDLRFAAHGDEQRWPLGRGIVARHRDPTQRTSFEDWRAAWG